MDAPQDDFARYSLNANPRASEFFERGYWTGKLLVDYFDEQVRGNAKKIALIDNCGEISYQDFQSKTRNLAAALIRLGVGKGDVVAVQCPNWRELPIAHFAVNRVGAIFLPLHDGFRDAELLHLLKTSMAKALIHPVFFHGYDHRRLVQSLLPALPELEHVIVMRGEAKNAELNFDRLSDDNSWEAIHGPDYLEAFRPASTDPLLIMVSSGSTGMPRCTVFCDEASAARTVQHFGRYATHLTADDVSAAIAPAGTGATGYVFPIMGALLFGATGVLMERWSGAVAEQALELVTKHRCTYLTVIPTQLVKLVSAAKDNPEKYDYRSVRFIIYGGAKLADSVAIEAEAVFGCPVLSIYGATEASAAAIVSVDDAAEDRRTLGHILAGVDVKIVDDAGHDLPPGKPGEICWRGVTSSYGFINDPETNASIRDRDYWHHSGDLGELDARGYLRIVGRKKDMIIRGGRNVNPGKIEEILLQHPKVMDVAVVPLADTVLGEVVCAVVIPAQDNAAPTLNELTQFIQRTGMALWYQPERLVIVDDFPRNAGGKTDKRALASMVNESELISR